MNIHRTNDLSYFFNRTCDELSVLDDFIFNSTQAQLVILCPTILNIFSLSIKLHSCTHILLVLPIAQMVEHQTVVLKVVGSNPTWQM